MHTMRLLTSINPIHCPQVVGIETEKVSKEKAVADEEEQKVAAIAVVVSGKQRDCEEDLAKAEPALLAAQDALNTLNKVRDVVLLIYSIILSFYFSFYEGCILFALFHLVLPASVEWVMSTQALNCKREH